MTAPTLNAVSIVVADMSASVAFYRQLGLEFAEGAESEAHAEAVAGGVRLLFDTPEVVAGFTPGWQPSGGGHAMALAFQCASPGDVDSQHAALTGAGARSSVDPFEAPWGQRYAVVLDPDDNPIDLYVPLG